MSEGVAIIVCLLPLNIFERFAKLPAAKKVCNNAVSNF